LELLIGICFAGTISSYCWKENPLVGFSDMTLLPKQLM
jgi:hypothetical protein